MARAASAKLQWRAGGEIACSCCGARYRIETAPLTERVDGYAKCESCGELLDEWICNQARRYERIGPAAPHTGAGVVPERATPR